MMGFGGGSRRACVLGVCLTASLLPASVHTALAASSGPREADVFLLAKADLDGDQTFSYECVGEASEPPFLMGVGHVESSDGWARWISRAWSGGAPEAHLLGERIDADEVMQIAYEDQGFAVSGSVALGGSPYSVTVGVATWGATLDCSYDAGDGSRPFEPRALDQAVMATMGDFDGMTLGASAGMSVDFARGAATSAESSGDLFVTLGGDTGLTRGRVRAEGPEGEAFGASVQDGITLFGVPTDGEWTYRIREASVSAFVAPPLWAMTLPSDDALITPTPLKAEGSS